MKHPIACLISDVHYNLTTLPLADAAVRQAVAKANQLRIPLIVAGDLHDTKANMRAECVNAMIATFKLCDNTPFIIRGNHCSLNEKSKDHALHFLSPHAVIIDDYYYDADTNLHMIAYHHDKEEFLRRLSTLPQGETLIVHQGCQGSEMGDYLQDKSAVTVNDVAGYRIISGHYHTRQSFPLPNGGQWDYVGNPYSLSWGEAKDPEKGFQLLYSDGSLEFIPTNLRKHVVFELAAKESKGTVLVTEPGDLVWVKISGTKEELLKVDKTKYSGYRLDLIPTETSTNTQIRVKSQSQPDLLDQLIESMQNSSPEQKFRLKELWRGL